MIYYQRLIFLFLFLAGANSIIFGQCTTGASFPLTFINPPLTTTQTFFMPQCSKSKVITTSGTTNQHSKVYVIAGYQYNFRSLSVGSAVAADFITIANDATGAPLFSGLNGTSGIYWTATLTGVIRFYTHTSAGCPTNTLPRSREVIMAPFQAKLSVINSLCSGNPGTGQYTVTVGPNHGWNYTSLISPLNAFTSAAVPAAGTIGTFAPRSYDIKLNGTSVNGNASTATNPEICPNCPGLITNGTSTWTEAAPSPPPYPGYTYISVTPIATAGTNTFTPTNTQTQTGIGTYTSPATFAGNNGSNQTIAVMPSGSISSLAAYNVGCGAYYFYPTITAPPNLLFNQSGTTIYSCGSGSVTLSANGGTAPYNISWFNQASSTIVTSPAGNEISTSGGSYTIPNLLAGTYTLTLTDANGCVKTILALIINPPPPPGTPTASVSAQPTCSTPTGTITVTSPVASSGTSYTLTGTNPVVAALTNTTGIFPNLASGTYQVISTAAGCASPPLTGLVVSAITLPALPTVVVSPATCSSNGTASISNYDITQTYDFAPPGPTIDALGLISGMTAGINYTVTSNIGACASSSSLAFIVDPQLITPPDPTISTAAATCSSVGTATISNYVSGQTYDFTPIGPTVGAGGGISGMTAGTSYTVTSSNGFCTSLNSLAFSIEFQLITPPAPIIATTAATCFSNGTATISNYVVGQMYDFNPIGPTVGTLGEINGLAVGTIYTVTSSNGFCISAGTSFIISAQLITPEVPLIITEPATCLSVGLATISNYVSGQTYVFSPSGPSVNSSGLISNMIAGISYGVTSNNGSCTSLDSAPFTIDFQLITPTSPLVDTTAATCLSDGTATISNYDNTLIYTFTPSGPTLDVTTGVISNMTTGTPYTVTSNNGSCTSLDSAPFTIEIQLSTPVAPLVDTTATTCLSDGTATISNHDNTLNYTFTPSGPTVDASGAISNITAGIAYTVTSFNGSCTSLDSAPFTIDFQLITPASPLVDTSAATCLLDGTATLSNYDNTLNYTFTPSGPTLDVITGVITNMATGSPYTITSNNGFCSIDSSPFTIDIQLITPADPTFATLAETCLSDEIATISNFDNTLIYTFNPSGPTIDAIGLISNITSGTSFTIISTNGFCISALVPLTVQPLLGNFNVIVDTTICSSNLPFSMNSLTFSVAGTQVANLIAANGCDSLVTINLTVIANDNSNFSQISPICFGDPLALPTSSLNGFSGTWSPAINNTDTTTYTFTPGIDQCGYTATMTIIVYPQVLVTITDTSICTGGTAILIATASPSGGDFFWSNANPTSSITVSPTFSTSYSVFYTSLNNCFATATRLLAVNPIPTATATSALICDGEIATIVATGLPTGGTYLWSPSGQATASINVSPSSTANYSVVYSRLGCESPVVNTVVTVNPVPILNLASEVICIGEDITMTAQTTIAGGVYDWGNGNSNATQTFSPQSDTTLTLSYSVNGCTSPIETATITVNPLPISTFSGSPLTGCIPLEVTLLADDNSNTSYSWSASNGLTGTGAQSSLTFTSGGIYDITLTAVLNGCFTTTTLYNYIEVDNYPIASFVPSSNSFTELSQLLEFTNTSSGANSYSWDFGDGGTSTDENTEHNFTANLNGHVITLTAYSQFLCESIATIEILFNNGLVYYIPNTFTPNGDEFNQTFKPIFSNSIDPYNYSFYIYNRWGHVIFETHDIERGWDGLFGEDGIPVPQGTYNYKIIVKFTETDERKEFFGHINLVR
jgi:gliding motility-associated-like protein